MNLPIKNSLDLLDPSSYKLKILLIAMPGWGKTSWLATAKPLGLGVAACETGYGSGMLSIASLGIDYVEPTTVSEFDSICSGLVFKPPKYSVVGLDSGSEMAKTFVKDHALTFPRKAGDSKKRDAGVPELDDYGVMGELTRSYFAKLIKQPQHIVVTSTVRVKEPDKDVPGSELYIGPDFPGQMFLGSIAQFDIVLHGKLRSGLRDPKDPKTRYQQRYFLTETVGSVLAKNRLTIGGKPTQPLLDKEEVFDLETGQGSFPSLLDKIQKRLQEFKEGHK